MASSCSDDDDTRRFLSILRAKLQHKYNTQLKDLDGTDENKRRWYRTKLLYSSLKSVIYHGSPNTDSLDQSDQLELRNICRDRLASAEVKSLLDGQPDQCLLGVGNCSVNKASSLTQDQCQSVERMIHGDLREKLLSISNFYQPSNPTAGDNLIRAKASQLARLVSQDVEAVEINKQEIIRLKDEETQQIRKLYETYRQSLVLCDELICRFKLKLTPLAEQQRAKYLAVKSDAFSAKLKLLHTQVMSETYTSDIAAQLTTIRGLLDQETARVRRLLESREQEYRACLSAGQEFHQLAKDYAQVLKDVQARKWALEELRTAKTHT